MKKCFTFREQDQENLNWLKKFYEYTLNGKVKLSEADVIRMALYDTKHDAEIELKTSSNWGEDIK